MFLSPIVSRRYWMPSLILVASVGGLIAWATRGPSDEARAYVRACEALQAELPEEITFAPLREAGMARVGNTIAFCSIVAAPKQHCHWIAVVGDGVRLHSGTSASGKSLARAIMKQRED